VVAFQQANGLKADGVVNKDTFDAIYSAPLPDGAVAPKPVYKFYKMDNQITLRKGKKGNDVKDLQTALTIKGFYSGPINGVFENKTASAVMAFQHSMGLKPDGKAGNYTLSAAYTMLNPPDLSTILPWPTGVDAGFAIPIEKLDWKVADKTFTRGMDAVIVDIGSGYIFNVRRTGGHNHADVETLTPADTATFYKAAGNFSWDRRPIWVIANGRRLAASMNCMPHGYDTISGNDFRGQFCIHFVNSRTHETNKIDPEHQKCIEEAYEAGLTMTAPPAVTAPTDTAASAIVARTMYYCP
jgi:peptidoglycan hydrolase-like protein with peptidoglycan-binding domain